MGWLRLSVLNKSNSWQRAETETKMRTWHKSEIDQIVKENSTFSDEELTKKYFDLLYSDVLGSQAERMEEAGYEESDVRERREYEDYMDGYTDILEWMLQRRGVDPWERFVKYTKEER